MYLRTLEMKDAPLMLEWMHDPSVVEKLHTNFAEKTLADAEGFISWSRDNFPEPPAMDVLPDALSGSGSDEFGKLQESEKKDESGRDLHLAIASGGDEYLGTVSLRHIKDGSAEFAITIRKGAMGTGAGWFGMSEILKKGFREYGLQEIFWCVSAENERAVRFYRKHDFREISEKEVPAEIRARYEEANDFLWFVATGETLE